jgi:hypothetical protein
MGSQRTAAGEITRGPLARNRGRVSVSVGAVAPNRTPAPRLVRLCWLVHALAPNRSLGLTLAIPSSPRVIRYCAGNRAV